MFNKLYGTHESLFDTGACTQVDEFRGAVNLVVMSGTAMHQQLEHDVGDDVSWSLRIAGGGATPFRTWLALQTLLLDRAQACPLVQQIISTPSALNHGGDPGKLLCTSIQCLFTTLLFSQFLPVEKQSSKGRKICLLGASLDAAVRVWEGADAVEAYCTGEGRLNPSQAGAVLAASAPSAQHGIALIQVNSI